MAERFDPILSASLCVVAAAAPLVMVRDAFDAANLPQSAFIQVSAAVLLTLWLVRGHLAGRFHVPEAPFVVPLLAFLAWSGASLLWARNRYEGVVVLLHWASCVAVGFVTADIVREPRDVRRLLRCLFAGGVAVALLGIAQHLLGVSWVPQAFPPAATFVNKNIAAQFTVMIVPIGVVLLLDAATAVEGGVLALGTVLLVAFVLYTRTRSAALALLAETVLMLIWRLRAQASSPPRWRPVLLLTAAALVVGVVHAAHFGADWGAGEAYEQGAAVWRALSTPPEPAPLIPASVTSVRGRLAIWRNTAEMVRDFPVRGVGLGNHAIFYPAYARRAVVDPLFGPHRQLDYVHDDYLQIAAELGLVGLAIAAWLGVTIVRTVSGAGRGALAAALPHVVMGLTAMILGALADACFSFPFRRALPPLLVTLALGLLTALSRSGAGRSFAAPRWLSLAACVAAAVATAGTAWVEWRWIESDRRCGQAVAAEARGDWPAAIAAASAARQRNPYRSEPMFILGSALQSAGESRQGAQVLEELLATNSYDPNALANLGLAYAQMGDSQQALDAFRRALALEPDEALLHFRVASLLKTLGDGAGALAELRLAARCDPRSAFYHHQWGIAALQRRSFGEAQKALEETLALDPNSAETQKALGVLLAEILGRKDEGIEHIRKALALDEHIRDGDHMRRMVESYDRERGSR